MQQCQVYLVGVVPKRVTLYIKTIAQDDLAGAYKQSQLLQTAEAAASPDLRTQQLSSLLTSVFSCSSSEGTYRVSVDEHLDAGGAGHRRGIEEAEDLGPVAEVRVSDLCTC